MSSLWVTYADVVLEGKYEYICYFHDKKSPYTQFAIHGEQFARRCYENLFGTPEVVKNVAEPISSIKEVKVFSGGGAEGGVASISGQVPVAIRQAFDVVKEATGVDLGEIMKAGTFDAKTTRNINLGGPVGGRAGEVVDAIVENPE